MPLHGKVVVINRSGVDGTEFPLTATCLFGRKPDCDIRIQLPHVSKEHCRIDLNENKEIILTNLSSVNPTRVNGEPVPQSERLKHGDVITIIDRSFRFEYPPAPTPKKRSTTGGKTETLKVLQDQQVGGTVTSETGDKRISEVSTDPHLKDGTNHDNIQRSLEKPVEVESKEDDSLLQSKTASPFNDLYQMIKKSLDVKTPRKSSASVLQTPTSRFCTPRPVSVRKNDGKPVIPTDDKITPKKDEAKASPIADETKGEAENVSNGTPKSVKKQSRSFQVPSTEMARPEVEEAENTPKSEATSPQKRNRTPPQRFTACEVTERVSAQIPKSPVRRRSKEVKPAVTKEQEEQAVTRKASPRNSGKVEKVKVTPKKRKSEELASDLPTQEQKRKRVSFGGFLCPELFDKRLPPDSPLRKGATPRRSLSVSKPKQSLLRRASVIGLKKEFERETGKKSPKSRSPSSKAASPGKKTPKSRTPSPKAASPGKKTPKSRTPSPKAASPGKKTPKSRTPSPKAASTGKKTLKSRTPSPKAASPGKKTPKSKSPSPARGRPPTVDGVQTPRIQGRFSVSHISTPSPVAEDAVTAQVPLVTVTLKTPLRRKSISRETPSMAKSAVKVMRRSGISRASMKVKNSYADIVRFGQTKPQVAAPAKVLISKKTTKKTVAKPKTPARKIKGHVSTGHADSPVTIVVGRAHKQKVVYPTGAAPRLVTNTALLKKNMKMDEDLTGIAEMLKTPVNDRKRRSVINENNATKTPVSTSVVEPSVLNTPEEPGEMMVSPLSVASTIKDRKYNTEAVQRLLNDDQESSFLSDTPALEIHSDDSSERQCTDLKTTSVITPKQKPELPECLTGVKRIMKTPRQKAEPIEDLRGKILKTPKQKPEQQECLTGVKRIMKTPRQKAEPVEDLRGKILKTPKQKPKQEECLTGVKRIMKTPRQKPEQQECLTGVKSMMKTPRQEAEPVEAIRMELLTTPKQKSEQQECLTGVKRISKTPQQEAQPLEDLQGKFVETPKALEAGDVSFHDVKEIVETPAHNQESEDLSEMTAVKSSPLVTPREKRLEKTPTQTSNAPVDDLEGNQELTEEPLTEPSGQVETNEVEDQTSLDCDEDVAKELDFVHKEPQDDVPTDVIDDVPQVDTEKEADADEVVNEHLEEVPSGHDDESSDAVEISQAAVDEKLSEEQPTADALDENLSVEQPKVDTEDEKLSEEQPTADAVDENMSEDQSTVDHVSEEQPKVETEDEKLSEEQPTADALDENLSVEQPKVDTEDEKLSEEQPTADAVDENLSVEQPTVDENMSEDQSTVDHVSEEQPEVDTVDDENVSEQQQPTVDAADENIFEDQPKVETATGKVTEMHTTATDPDHVKKPVRGRRAKTVESTAAVDKQEAAEHAEDPVVPAPVRGRRGMKTEATAPPAVRQTARGRNAKSQESRDVELTVEKSVSQPSNVALKPKRGRQAKKASNDQAETVQEVSTEIVPEPESEQSPPGDVHHEANDSAAPLEKVVLKPRRGRKAKQPEQSAPEQEDVPSTHGDNVPQADMAKADANEVCSGQLEVLPSGGDANKTMETVPPAPVSESLPEVETDTCKVTEMDAAVVQKKPVRGRRVRVVESKQEAAEHSEDTVVPVPVRGRRGKKTETTAPPAVRQTTRDRNAKSQESPCDDQPETVPEKGVETTLVTETSTEAVSDQTSSIKETDSAPPAEEAVVKPVRGRKTKQTPVEPPQPEPEKNQVVIDLTADAQPQKSSPTLGKPKRGRKTKADTVEENEVAEDKVVVLETKQQSQPPVRTKRGRNAKQEEEKLESTAVETTKSQEPAKKMRRTRKAEQDPEESREVQAAETIVPEEVEAPPVAEPVKLNEQASVATKPRRGGRKAKQDTENETPVESTEVQEVPAVSSTDKLKRGRRGKQVTEEVAVTAVVPEEKSEHALEDEEKKNAEPDAPVIKPSRAKPAKSSVKNDVSQAIPAKRARRGAALPLEETNAESSDLVSEPVSTSVQPPKRGRRAAAKPTADDATASSDQANPTEDASSAVGENAKKSVKWGADVEVFELPKATTIKAVRGRKSKLGGQVDTESKTVSKDANETEEKDLSDKVVEAQPVKRARRGAKVADVTTDEAESTNKAQSVEADAQPKTRRGRSAKK